MTHIANQRIKKDGKYYAAGDPITLTDDDLAELPEGAATVASPEKAKNLANNEPTGDDLTDEQIGKLADAATTLTDADFKNDGDIRAGALKALNELLDFKVTVEDVAAAKPTFKTE